MARQAPQGQQSKSCRRAGCGCTPARSRRATDYAVTHPTFYSVPDTARILGMSAMTLYRAIQDGQFPAVRIRGRLIVPARVIEAMAEATLADGRVVDAADWVRET